jgi:hypothetical protein
MAVVRCSLRRESRRRQRAEEIQSDFVGSSVSSFVAVVTSCSKVVVFYDELLGLKTIQKFEIQIYVE